jgi:hypothetical protein
MAPAQIPKVITRTKFTRTRFTQRRPRERCGIDLALPVTSVVMFAILRGLALIFEVA